MSTWAVFGKGCVILSAKHQWLKQTSIILKPQKRRAEALLFFLRLSYVQTSHQQTYSLRRAPLQKSVGS